MLCVEAKLALKVRVGWWVLREEFLRKHLKADEHERKEREARRAHEQQDELKELYAVPEHLQVGAAALRRQIPSSQMNTQKRRTLSLAVVCLQVRDRTEEFKDQMNWVTGLVEVELPME